MSVTSISKLTNLTITQIFKSYKIHIQSYKMTLLQRFAVLLSGFLLGTNVSMVSGHKWTPRKEQTKSTDNSIQSTNDESTSGNASSVNIESEEKSNLVSQIDSFFEKIALSSSTGKQVGKEQVGNKEEVVEKEQHVTDQQVMDQQVMDHQVMDQQVGKQVMKEEVVTNEEQVANFTNIATLVTNISSTFLENTMEEGISSHQYNNRKSKTVDDDLLLADDEPNFLLPVNFSSETETNNTFTPASLIGLSFGGGPKDQTKIQPGVDPREKPAVYRDDKCNWKDQDDKPYFQPHWIVLTRKGRSTGIMRWQTTYLVDKDLPENLHGMFDDKLYTNEEKHWARGKYVSLATGVNNKETLECGTGR